jgi:hypothetical protein
MQNKTVYSKLTSSGVPTYLVVVYDAILKSRTRYGEWTQYKEAKAYSEIFRMMTTKYHSKILYALYTVGFGSQHFVRRRAKVMDRYWLEKIFDDFETQLIVKEMSATDEDNDIIMKFWKREFTNTRTKKPVSLYCITKEFLPVVQAFAGIIESHFFSRSEISYLLNLRKRYESYAEGVRKNLKLAQAESAQKLGNCHACGRIIHKGSERGKHYHKFAVGLICDHCARKSTKDQMKQWMRPKE